MSRPRPAEPSDPRLLWAVFVALAAIWGSSFLFIKIGVETLPPLWLVTYRLLFGIAFLAFWLRLRGTPLVTDRVTLGKLAAMSLLNVAIPFGLITWGEQYIPSAMAAVLNGTVPLFTMVVAALALHDEPITVNRLVGLVVGFAGLVALVSPHLGGLGGGDDALELLGELAVVLASVSYACATVFARRALGGLSPVQIALPQLSGALAVTVVLALLTERPLAGGPIVLPTTPSALFAVGWLGILGSGVAYLFFFRLIAGFGATRTTLVTYLMPVVGIALGLIVLGEVIDLRILFGTALILGGIVLVNSRIGGRRLFGRAIAVPLAVAGGSRPPTQD